MLSHCGFCFIRQLFTAGETKDATTEAIKCFRFLNTPHKKSLYCHTDTNVHTRFRDVHVLVASVENCKAFLLQIAKLPCCKAKVSSIFISGVS